MTLAERWIRTWRLVGLAAPAGLLGDLEGRYSERHRAYHTAAHILDCLALASGIREQLVTPAAVELALWYHDAVYDPRRSDNEERSAELASRQLLAAGTSLDLGEIRRLILATRHPSNPTDSDARFVVDIDLAILGSPPDRFRDYDLAIRREYAWVPSSLYTRRRREVLRSFLSSDRVYLTEYFRQRFEATARANIQAALRSHRPARTGSGGRQTARLG